MTLTVFQLILLQGSLCIGAWLLVLRRRDLSIFMQLVVVIAYLTTPMAILIKGTQSAIYASDLLLPLLIVGLCLQPYRQRWVRSPIVWCLGVFLVLLPVLLIPIHVLMSGGEVGLGGRNAKGDVIWLYRNVIYLSLFAIAWAWQLSRQQFISFVELNIGLAGLLTCLGLVHYFSSVNLAIFEQLTWKDWVQEGYQSNHAGLGFMGLFRASVGQWFASVFVLVAGTWTYLSPRWKFPALVVLVLSIGMVLLCHSRAGFVGLAVGVAMLGILGQGLHHRVAAAFGILMLTFWMTFQGDLFSDRISSIVTGSQHATDRVKAWERGMGFFSDHLEALAVGVGPANREAVAKVTGAYGAHNEYLDVVFRLGIMGFVSLIVVLVMLFKATFGRRHGLDSQGKAFATTIGILVLVNAVMGITQEHLLHDYASHTMGIFLYVLYGTGLGMLQQSRVLSIATETAASLLEDVTTMNAARPDHITHPLQA